MRQVSPSLVNWPMALCYWVRETPYLSYLRWTSWSRDRAPSQDTGSEAHPCDSISSFHIFLTTLSYQSPSKACRASAYRPYPKQALLPLWSSPLIPQQRNPIQLDEGHAGRADDNDIYPLARAEHYYKSQQAMSSPGCLRTFTCIQSSATDPTRLLK